MFLACQSTCQQISPELSSGPVSKGQPGFFTRIFRGERTVPPSTPLEQRLTDLERQLRSAILEWDDALDRLHRLAGRASKLKSLQEAPGATEPPLTRVEQLNQQIIAERLMRPPHLNGSN